MENIYVFIPRSVQGVVGLQPILTHRDTQRNVTFKGVRAAKGPMSALSDEYASDLEDVELGSVVIFLQTALDPLALADLLDDNSSGVLQGDLIPASAIKMEEYEGYSRPVGTGAFLLPPLSDNDDEHDDYFVLAANLALAKRICRQQLMPELIYGLDEAVEGFPVLRREIELYMWFGRNRWSDILDNLLSMEHDKLIKALWLIDKLADEAMPGLRDMLSDREFRNEFTDRFLGEIEKCVAEEDNTEAFDTEMSNLVTVFCLLRGFVGTEERVSALPECVPSDIKKFLKRIT